MEEKFSCFVDEFNARFEELNNKVEQISLERNYPQFPRVRTTRVEGTAQQVEPDLSHVASSTAPAGAAGTRQDIQGEFQALKDSLTRIQLPADLKLNDSRQGICRNDQGTLSVIAKCGRFSETLVKLLTTLDADKPLSQVTIEQLFLIAHAQTCFLQDEYASLIVNNQFDSGTAKLFRALQKNTSGLNPSSLETLRSAAAISAAGRQAPAPAPRGQGHSARGRRGGFHYQGNAHRQDTYQSFTHRPFPRRPFPRGDNQNPTQED